MSAKTKGPKCKGTVWSNYGPGKPVPCRRYAVGGEYCRLHDPSEKVARKAADVARWDAQNARQQAQHDVVAATNALLDLVRDGTLVTALAPNPAPRILAVLAGIRETDEALAKAGAAVTALDAKATKAGTK